MSRVGGYWVILCVVCVFPGHVLAANATTRTSVPRYEYYSRGGGGTNDGRRTCNTEQVEYRLTKLEVQLAEKSEQLVSELREGNRRLNAVESSSEGVQTALEGFRTELGRFAQDGRFARSNGLQQANNQECNEKLEMRVENLVRGVQLVVAALKGLNSDIAWVKKNISSISNTTSTLQDEYDNLVSKQFLLNSLIDLKHHQVQQHSMTHSHGHNSNERSSSSDVPKNCKEIQESGISVSGIYQIQPENSPKPFMVLCDMETKDGGWTYIHNRYDGSQDFFLNWHDYKTGFGNLGGEFWLGLENLYHLTGHEVNELLIELVDGEEKGASAHYAAFSIGSELEGYALKVLSGYSGDAGDSLTYHAGSRFSAKDLDRDSWVEGNCAQAHGGAWWYRSCDTSNLNGKYLNGDLPEDYLYQGMYWGEFKGAQYSLAQARMMIRPRGKDSPPIFPFGIAGNRRT